MKYLLTFFYALLMAWPIHFIFSWLSYQFLGFPPSSLKNIITAVLAFTAAWFVARALGKANKLAINSILKSAAFFGAIGLVLGIIIPVIFLSNANQAPLTGIFITGPLGAILGAFGKFIQLKWLTKKD